MKKELIFKPNQVVYIFAQLDLKHTTGVVNRQDDKTGMVNVFIKGQSIGVWFYPSTLKVIGGKGRTARGTK